MANKDVGRTLPPFRWNALGFGLLLLGVCVVIASFINQPVQAAGYSQVILHPGNVNSCTDVGFSQTILNTFSTPPAGTSTINGVTFTIDGTQTTVLSWSSAVPIGAVVVKGSQDAYVYVYSPAALGDPSAGLVSPPNPGGTPTISHILFCSNGDTVTNTPTQTATAITTNTPTSTATAVTTNTPTATATGVATETATPTGTVTTTTTPTVTTTATATATTTGTPPATNTPITQTPTVTQTAIASPTPTATGGPVLTSTPTPTATGSPVSTSTPILTATPTLVGNLTSTPTTIATATITPTATATLQIPGSITIIKATNAPTGDTFAFSGAGSSFVLASGGSAVFSNLTPSVYSFSETGPAPGWQLAGINCTGTALNNLGLNPGSNLLTVNLQAGENVTCVFTNNLIPVMGGGVITPPPPPAFTAQVLGVTDIPSPTPEPSLPPAQAVVQAPAPTQAPPPSPVAEVAGARLVIVPPSTGDGAIAETSDDSSSLRTLSFLVGGAMIATGLAITLRSSLRKA